MLQFRGSTIIEDARPYKIVQVFHSVSNKIFGAFYCPRYTIYSCR